jgi:hypothetical protein
LLLADLLPYSEPDVAAEVDNDDGNLGDDDDDGKANADAEASPAHDFMRPEPVCR